MASNLVFQGLVLLGTEPSAALCEHGLASTDMGKESKQVLRVSARTVACSPANFLTVCSKMEVFNIRAKH